MQADERKILDLALAQGYLTPAQAQQVAAQQQAAQASGRPAPLGPLLARVLSPEQVDALRAALGGAPATGAQQFLQANPGFLDQPTAAHEGAAEAMLLGPNTKLPDRLGAYVLERELARGGMGAVFVARHVELGRRVALKLMLDADPTRLKRFQIEARVTAQLRHPNIVAIHEVGEQDGLHYLVMDLIEGESLAERLQRDGPLDPREAARIAERLARALFYAHSHGILHRDLKPANVLIDERGEPLLTDFGLAKQEAAAESLTRTGQRVGTPAYMAPEQARGEKDWIDRRTDVYALGLVLYRMLTNRLPYEADVAVNFMVAILYHPPTPPSTHRRGLDRDLETICLKCLEKQSTRRYSGAGALADDLARWLAGDPIEARRAGLLERAWRGVRRSPSRSAVALVVLALALIALGLGRQWWVGEQLRQAREEEERGLTAVAELRRVGWGGSAAEAARAALAKAVALDPSLRRSWVLLARLALEADDADEAARCLARARALAPLEGEAGYLQGRLDDARGALQAAQAGYRAAWEGGYRPPEIVHRRARIDALLHAQGERPQAAEEAWWAALRERPLDPEPLAGIVRLRLAADDAVGLVRGWGEVHRRLGRPGEPGLQHLLTIDADPILEALEGEGAPPRARLRAALGAAYYPRPQMLRALDRLGAVEAPSHAREAARASSLAMARPISDRRTPIDFAGWCRATGAGAGPGAAEALTLLERAPRLTERDVPSLRTLIDTARAPLLRAAIPLALAYAGTREGGVELAQAKRLVARLTEDGDAFVQARARVAETALELLGRPGATTAPEPILLVRALLLAPGARRGLRAGQTYPRALAQALESSPVPALHLARAYDLLEEGRAGDARAAVAAALEQAPTAVDALALQRQLELRDPRAAERDPAPLAADAAVDPARRRYAEARVAFTRRFGLVALPAPNGEVRVVAHFGAQARSPRWQVAFDAHGYRPQRSPFLAAGGALTLVSRFAFSHWTAARLEGAGDCHSMRLRFHAGDLLGDNAGITYVVRHRWGESQLLVDGDAGRRVWRGHARWPSFRKFTTVALRRPDAEAYLDGVSQGTRTRAARRRRSAGNLVVEYRWGGGTLRRLVLVGRWDPRARAPAPPPTVAERKARMEVLRPMPGETEVINTHGQRVSRAPTLARLRRAGWSSDALGLWRGRRVDAKAAQLPEVRGDCELRAQVAFRPVGRDSRAGIALFTEDGDVLWFGPTHHENKPVLSLVVQRNWILPCEVRERPLAAAPLDPPIGLRLQRFGDYIVPSYALRGGRFIDMLERPLYFPLDSDPRPALFASGTDPKLRSSVRFDAVEVRIPRTE